MAHGQMMVQQVAVTVRQLPLLHLLYHNSPAISQSDQRAQPQLAELCQDLAGQVEDKAVAQARQCGGKHRARQGDAERGGKAAGVRGNHCRSRKSLCGNGTEG